jgi:hypothetical protein
MTMGSERLTVSQNAAIQGFVAYFCLFIWQLGYTYARFDMLIRDPMRAAGTTFFTASMLFSAFALASLVHSYAFYYTLRHHPGGATGTGILKGLQAVLVFLATHLFYCGRVGGNEMCLSSTKSLSLVTVVFGVALFGVASEQQQDRMTTRGERYSRTDGEGESIPRRRPTTSATSLEAS